MENGKKICWLCHWGWKHSECVYQEITPSERKRDASLPLGGDAPAILGKTKEGQIRPDENNPTKELVVAARQMEQAGLLKPGQAEKMKRQIARSDKSYGHESSLMKKEEHAVPYVIPNDVRHGLKLKRHY